MSRNEFFIWKKSIDELAQGDPIILWMVELGGYFNRIADDGFLGEITYSAMMAREKSPPSFDVRSNAYVQSVIRKWEQAGLIKLNEKSVTFLVCSASFTELRFFLPTPLEEL